MGCNVWCAAQIFTSSRYCQHLGLVKMWWKSELCIKEYNSLSAGRSVSVLLLEEPTFLWAGSQACWFLHAFWKSFELFWDIFGIVANFYKNVIIFCTYFVCLFFRVKVVSVLFCLAFYILFIGFAKNFVLPYMFVILM